MADAIELGVAAWDEELGEWFLPVPAGCERDPMGEPPTMSRVAERLAEANAVIAQHGAGAMTFVVNRVVVLRGQGDDAGVRRWAEIAAGIEQLRRRPH